MIFFQTLNEDLTLQIERESPRNNVLSEVPKDNVVAQHFGHTMSQFSELLRYQMYAYTSGHKDSYLSRVRKAYSSLTSRGAAKVFGWEIPTVVKS